MRHGIVLAALLAVALAAASAVAQSGSSSRPGLAAPAGTVDRQLEDRVFLRLARDPRVGPGIQVHVHRGVVSLTGLVADPRHRARAVRIARRTPGVIAVRDELRVATPPLAPTVAANETVRAGRAARQIAAAIAGAQAGPDWWADAWRVEGPANRWRFTVQADEGVLWLEGEVPRDDVARTAVEVARGIDGIRHVRNELEVSPQSSWWSDPARHDPYGAFPYGYGPADADDEAGVSPPAAPHAR